MTARGRRAILRLESVRRKQRDHAAALLVVAEQARESAARALAGEHVALDTLDDTLTERLARNAARALELFAAERQHARAAIDDARSAAATRDTVALNARLAAGVRERELRIAENHLERWRAEEAAELTRAEQRQTDELAARRPGRRP